jgi:hypothetical protein
MLPSVPDELKEDVEEETRVLFVGATRARMTLRTGEGIRITADATQMSKRCFRALRRRGVPRAQVEVGHDGDVNLRRLVAESLFERSEDAVASQAALRRMIGYSSEISAWSVAEDGFTYFLRAGVTMDAPIIGVLEKAFNSDLFEVSRSCGAGGRRVKLPAVIRHIRCIGVRTVAVAPDDPILPKLHRPFCDSGFFLAPVISGFTTIEFHDANRR